MEPQLEWKMVVSGTSLDIHYVVKNPGPGSIWLVDDMLVSGPGGFVRNPAAVVVRNSGEKDTVSFYRGRQEVPIRSMRDYPSPGVREVPAGKEVSADLKVSLPLTAWHYFHPKKLEPLTGASTRAVLEIQYLATRGTAADDGWSKTTLADGSKLAYPRLSFLVQQGKVLRSEPKLVPKGQ